MRRPRPCRRQPISSAPNPSGSSPIRGSRRSPCARRPCKWERPSRTRDLIELGRACGFVEEFPSEDITWYIDECLKPSGITYEQLLAHPHGLEYGNIEYEKFAKVGFRAPGGKVNIVSEVLLENGFDGLPNWEDSSESLRSEPELAEKYPYVVFTGRSGPMYVHEQRRTIRGCARCSPRRARWSTATVPQCWASRTEIGSG